jgi:lysophospholipase L1-like esterase
MLTSEGTPNATLLVDDGLHMNEKGYEIWTAAVNSVMKDVTVEVETRPAPK